MAAKRKYDWEVWFGQPRTRLSRGVDYHCSQAMMWQQIRSRAYEQRVKIRITDTHDGFLIEVLDAVPHPDKTAVAS